MLVKYQIKIFGVYKEFKNSLLRRMEYLNMRESGSKG
jgi:hypothetical protein